jgi:hypothetical protein
VAPGWYDPECLFPLAGLISIIVSTSAGEPVEIGTVGNEGVAGVPVSMGVNRAIGRALFQSPGEAIVTSGARFRDLAIGDPAMASIINRYTYFFVRLVAETGLCHRFHSADERCARWLLGAHDRAGTDQFALTQDFLALMMGTRRPRANLEIFYTLLSCPIKIVRSLPKRVKPGRSSTRLGQRTFDVSAANRSHLPTHR